MTQVVYEFTYPRDGLSGLLHIEVVETVQTQPPGPPASVDGGTWERRFPYLLPDEQGNPRSFKTHADALEAATAWKRAQQQQHHQQH